jgi:hypothetical protein
MHPTLLLGVEGVQKCLKSQQKIREALKNRSLPSFSPPLWLGQAPLRIFEGALWLAHSACPA